MAVIDYIQTLERAKRLSSKEQVRLIKELAVRLMGSGKAVDLSRLEDAVAYVERMRRAESRHKSGRLKTPGEFLAELESWEG